MTPLKTTLVIPHTDTHVLLGMKKRGFGAGRWNGFGGKVGDGETIEKAAVREFCEETNCRSAEIVSAGELHFTFQDENERPIAMHIFRVRDFSGSPSETEEMKPQWFAFGDVPYTQMWPDDIYWLPKFLRGEAVRGACHFQDFDTILHFRLEE